MELRKILTHNSTDEQKSKHKKIKKNLYFAP